jgi:hypothetical protein
MFHAFLFAASSHLDVLRGEHDSPVTIFHRGQAIRLVNDTLAHLDAELPDTIIAATMTLGQFEVGPQSLAVV